MSRNKMKHKVLKNNKGMTLVEVLVAMMILTVVSLVLLRAFVSATKYNKIAKEKQREITLAQSIMESFKAYDMEEIVKQFHGVDVFRIYSGAHGTVGEVGGNSYDASKDEFVRNDGGADPANADKYEFKIESVDYDGGLYDVQITLEPDKSVNSLVEIAEAPEFNKFNDAFYSGETAEQANALILDKVKNYLVTYEAFDTSDSGNPNLDSFSDMSNYIVVDSRDLYVTMDYSGSAQIVNVKSVYDFEINGISFTCTDGTSVTDAIYDSSLIDDVVCETKIYDNSITGAGTASLNNVYINYCPYYANPTVDSIHINNNLGTVKDVYLIKLSQGYSGTLLNTYESSYRPSVSVANCELYTNVYTHLVTGNQIAGTMPLSSFHLELYKKEWKNLEYIVKIKVTNQKTSEEFELVGSIYDK
ncbi:MAG: prepilin-type N-terminal cleavage/methylation domain-containing protein [Lachnospiraceae bacterium]